MGSRQVPSGGYTRKEYEEAADYVRGRTRHEPRIGLILGSGLNPLAGSAADADVIPYAEVPYFPKPTVEGHVGRLVIGRLAGAVVLSTGVMAQVPASRIAAAALYECAKARPLRGAARAASRSSITGTSSASTGCAIRNPCA